MVDSNTSFSDALSQNQTLVFAFQRYGFDIGDNDKNIKDTCIEKGVNYRFFIEILNAFEDSAAFPKKELEQFPIDVIIDYLQRTHKQYLNKRLPEIEQSIFHLLEGYQHNHSLLMQLLNFFYDYKTHLTNHIRQEEEKLFPYIKTLCEIENGTKSLHLIDYKIKRYCVNDFIDQHDDTESELKNVRKTIRIFSPDESSISPYRILLTQLRLMEQDLYIHAQLEDEILMPKALKLENDLKDNLKLIIGDN